MLPFQQGRLDSLCGIYSLVNAEQKINNTKNEKSEKLFDSIVNYLDGQNILASTLKGGMRLKQLKSILADVIGDRIPYQRLPFFAGAATPDLNTFWAEIESFLNVKSRRAVLLCLSGIPKRTIP